MKIEFVEFYPYKPMNPKKNDPQNLGTVHIYLIEEELDIRGIIVRKGKDRPGMFFSLPHFKTVDSETGQMVTYPLLRFTNESKHKQLLNFLHEEVKPIIKQRLLIKGE